MRLDGSAFAEIAVRGDSVEGGAVIKIGKLPSSHLQIEDETVSRMHATIELSHGECRIDDLNSPNGTFVNGERIGNCPLKEGDTIVVGSVILKVRKIVHSTAEPTSEPAPEPVQAPVPIARPPPAAPQVQARADPPLAHGPEPPQAERPAKKPLTNRGLAARVGLLIVGGFLVCAGGIYAHNYLNGKDAAAKRGARIAQMTDEFRSCRPGSEQKKRLAVKCMSDTERTALLESAEGYKHSGQYKQAGLIYAELGELTDADSMVRKCNEGDRLPGGNVRNQDPKGAEQITEMTRMRSEALEKSVRSK